MTKSITGAIFCGAVAGLLISGLEGKLLATPSPVLAQYRYYWYPPPPPPGQQYYRRPAPRRQAPSTQRQRPSRTRAESRPQRRQASENVRRAQTILNQLGYEAGEVDGYMGPQTGSAVTKFQRDNGLTADGVVGPATINKLKEVQAGRSTSVDIDADDVQESSRQNQQRTEDNRESRRTETTEDRELQPAEEPTDLDAPNRERRSENVEAAPAETTRRKAPPPSANPFHGEVVQ